VDYPEHAKRLKRYGTAIEAGQSALITKLKVKGNLIEFQLDGGGYGTSGDPTNPTVTAAAVPKTQREKDLEAALKTETDPAAKRLPRAGVGSTAKRPRARGPAQPIVAASATERRREYIQQRRLQGAPLQLALPYGACRPTPCEWTRCAPRWTSSSHSMLPASRRGRKSIRCGRANGALALRKGLLVEEWTPARRAHATHQPQGGHARGNEATYDTRDGRVVADFVEDVLVRYTVTSQ
jgi:hypothetical protein